jgi:hypothetical protein
MRITDGRGNAYEAAVSKDQRLLTDALSIPELAQRALEGYGFFAISGLISLTSTGLFSGILYLKNTSSLLLDVHAISVCGSVGYQTQWIKKPTTGTLISGGTPIVPGNLNTASGGVFGGTVRSGADALTITDGTLWNQEVCGAGKTRTDVGGAIIVAPNDAIAITIKPTAAGVFSASLLVGFSDE